ncbi:MAG: TerD family protein [Ruminococcus sp.]|jgi:stress response protein SCP2|uniref:TerD family protein n=1 Tax=Ruminococcus sp. TaxID=41978 RepID=UPI0025F4E674|nr:TerD family protein [Ruminococcus sp.]MBR0529545.1 TerD family protein [Ruminococcus sp.]
MSISLQKGQKVSLSKESAGLSKVIVGLGWDEANRPQPQQKQGGFFSGLFGGSNTSGNMQSVGGDTIDCDAAAFMLQNGRLVNKNDIIYYGNLRHATGTVVHMGDNLTGAGDGDDEQIVVDLAQVPPQYDRIVVTVNIYHAKQKNQHFGMINNAFIRLVDARNNKEICRYNLTESYPGITAMVFGEIYRHNNEWKFNAIGQGTNDGSLSELAGRYAGM